MSQFLGIDMGTTFLKGAVLDLDVYALRDIRRVAFSGGLAQRFERLRREGLRELGGELPHRVCPSAEDTLLGLLSMALSSSGRARDRREAARRVVERHLPEHSIG